MHLLDLDSDEWICKGANTIKDAKALIEAGFEYVTEIDGTKLFRKRKYRQPPLFLRIKIILAREPFGSLARSR
jgi:hypothetical protein